MKSKHEEFLNGGSLPDVSWCDEVEEDVEGDPGPDPLAEPRARLELLESLCH